MRHVRADYSWTLHQAFSLRLLVFFILTLLVKSSSLGLCLAHFFLWTRLNVRFIRGREILLRTGRLWYQNVLVGGFMSRRLPWASSSFTGSICRRIIFPRASLCRKIKSRAAPRETEAMGHRGSSSLSSSRCSPMWSRPSLYLVEEEKETHSAGRPFPKTHTHFSPVDQNKVEYVSRGGRDGIPNVFQCWSPRRGHPSDPRIGVG